MTSHVGDQGTAVRVRPTAAEMRQSGIVQIGMTVVVGLLVWWTSSATEALIAVLAVGAGMWRQRRNESDGVLVDADGVRVPRLLAPPRWWRWGQLRSVTVRRHEPGGHVECLVQPPGLRPTITIAGPRHDAEGGSAIDVAVAGASREGTTIHRTVMRAPRPLWRR